MREVLPVHEPLLVNTLGHSAGTLIFAIFVFLLLRDRAGARLRGSRLTLAAASLALIWNLASLLVMAADPRSLAAQALVALSSSALSILPGVLLHISLGPRFGWIRMAGYALAGATVVMHTAEVFYSSLDLHFMALNLTTFGFGTLTAASIVSLLRMAPGEERRLVPRLLAAMSLFLFSLSLVHLGGVHTHSWPMELMAHHAGIVLALFVLLQDYRFLLLDAFLRFLVNILLAAGFVFAAVRARALVSWAAGDPFRDGMLLVGCCLSFLLYAFLRSRIDHLFSRLLLARRQVGTVLQPIRTYTGVEAELVPWAARLVGEFFDAPVVSAARPEQSLAIAAPVSDLAPADRERLERLGVEAVIPLRSAARETGYILLGRRSGGRRYLSEDFAGMRRIQAQLVETIERLHEDEMRRLVNEAELRALQSQIHPHFLFNVLNTLYGVIPRQAEGARRTVLNLSDIFRYFLNTDRAFLPLEEELQIVRSYLEIEQLRLGNRLRWEIEVDDEARRYPIPILTVQPLVENAVKHGIAPSPEGGLVRLEARVEGEGLRIRVTDTGVGFVEKESAGAGVGLDNVRKRLRLSHGTAAALRIESGAGGATVEFLLPADKTEAVAP